MGLLLRCIEVILRLSAGLFSRTLNSGHDRFLMAQRRRVVEAFGRPPTGDADFFFQDQPLLG
jgi:hypothetical protein